MGVLDLVIFKIASKPHILRSYFQLDSVAVHPENSDVNKKIILETLATKIVSLVLHLDGNKRPNKTESR